MADLLTEQEHFAHAEEGLRDAVRANAEDGMAHNSLAWFLYCHGGDLGEAEEVGRRATALCSGEGAIWHTLAAIQLKAQGWEAALAALKTWIDSPDASSFQEEEVADPFRTAMDQGKSVDLATLLASARYPEQWTTWLAAIRAFGSWESQLEPPSDRLLQVLRASQGRMGH